MEKCESFLRSCLGRWGDKETKESGDVFWCSIRCGHMGSSGGSAAGGGHSPKPVHAAHFSLQTGVCCSPALTAEPPVEMVRGQFIKNKLDRA